MEYYATTAWRRRKKRPVFLFFFFFFFFCSKAQPASHFGAKSFHCESSTREPGVGAGRGATFTHKPPHWNFKHSSAAPQRRAKCILLQLARLNKCHVARVVPASGRHASCAPLPCGKLQLWQRQGPEEIPKTGSSPETMGTCFSGSCPALSPTLNKQGCLFVNCASIGLC